MNGFSALTLGERPEGRWALAARWIIADTAEGRRLVQDGEVVIEEDRIIHAGPRFEGELAARHDMGEALIAPGFVDLDALSDLDTTLLAFDNWPAEKKGRVWPRSYVEAGPYEMYSPEELAFQKRFAFAQLLLNGITSAAPIASLFYREWGRQSLSLTLRRRRRRRLACASGSAPHTAPAVSWLRLMAGWSLNLMKSAALTG